MFNILNELPKGKLESNFLDSYVCLCGKWQPLETEEFILCANCGRIAKDKYYPHKRKT